MTDFRKTVTPFLLGVSFLSETLHVEASTDVIVVSKKVCNSNPEKLAVSLFSNTSSDGFEDILTPTFVTDGVCMEEGPKQECAEEELVSYDPVQSESSSRKFLNKCWAGYESTQSIAEAVECSGVDAWDLSFLPSGEVHGRGTPGLELSELDVFRNGRLLGSREGSDWIPQAGSTNQWKSSSPLSDYNRDTDMVFVRFLCGDGTFGGSKRVGNTDPVPRYQTHQVFTVGQEESSQSDTSAEDTNDHDGSSHSDTTDHDPSNPSNNDHDPSPFVPDAFRVPAVGYHGAIRIMFHEDQVKPDSWEWETDRPDGADGTENINYESFDEWQIDNGPRHNKTMTVSLESRSTTDYLADSSLFPLGANDLQQSAVSFKITFWHLGAPKGKLDLTISGEHVFVPEVAWRTSAGPFGEIEIPFPERDNPFGLDGEWGTQNPNNSRIQKINAENFKAFQIGNGPRSKRGPETFSLGQNRNSAIFQLGAVLSPGTFTIKFYGAFSDADENYKGKMELTLQDGSDVTLEVGDGSRGDAEAASADASGANSQLLLQVVAIAVAGICVAVLAVKAATLYGAGRKKDAGKEELVEVGAAGDEKGLKALLVSRGADGASPCTPTLAPPKRKSLRRGSRRSSTRRSKSGRSRSTGSSRGTSLRRRADTPNMV